MAVSGIAAVIAQQPEYDGDEDKGYSVEVVSDERHTEAVAWEEVEFGFPHNISAKITSTLTTGQKIHAILDASGFAEEHYAEQNSIPRYIALIISFSLIIFSVIIFTLDSLPAYYRRDLMSFFISEAVCIGWFTGELAIRATTCPSLKEFLKSAMNWIDFVAILPFYLDIVIRLSGSGGSANANGLVLLRVIRLTRAFRVFKLSKYNEGVQMVVAAVVRSQDALSLLAFLTTIATVLFGSSMFYAEQGAAKFDDEQRKWIRNADGEPHPFKSIPHAFWWCLVTVTSVGYGDMFPVTVPGYLVGCATMMSGLLLVAFPIIILGANFTEARIEYLKEKELETRFRKYQRMYLIEKLGPPGLTPAEVQNIFESVPPLPESLAEELQEPSIESDDVTELIKLFEIKLNKFEYRLLEFVPQDENMVDEVS